MNNLERFTSPASGANIKALLKQLNDKGAQLRSVLWLETQTTPPVEGVCDCDDGDDDECDYCLGMIDEPEQFEPCQLELSVGNNMVLTELFAEQIDQILPMIKEWVVRDLEIIEKKLNNQGVYLEGPGANQAQVGGLLPAKPFHPVNTQFLSKPVEKGDLVVAIVDIDVKRPNNIDNLVVKKGTRCRVLDVETYVETNSILAHIQPEASLEIYRVLAQQVQPIQE
ncbi:MAG: hypothetical protein JKX78_03580 [Alteromonadaceae bacterium]|nr:hypothetical protein [Alteromonadaceae bacterium]MBL4909099.1 hypothetical protein [Alteromonadaceae bacterium]